MKNNQKTEYDEMSAKELLRVVDDKFYEAKRNKVSRYDIEWGKWSREFNLSLRARLEDTSQDSNTIEGLKYVFTYWITISNILEMYHGFGSVLHAGKRKKFEREANKIKKIIVNEIFGKLKNISFEDLSKTLLIG